MALTAVATSSGCQSTADSDTHNGSHTSRDWRSAADPVIRAVTDGGDTPQTLAPDPSLNDPPERVAALVFVPTAASDLEARLAPAVAEYHLKARCTAISRARALELLAEPSDGKPNIPSSICNVTRAEEPFGFFLFAARTKNTTTIWYELGPDAAPQTP